MYTFIALVFIFDVLYLLTAYFTFENFNFYILCRAPWNHRNFGAREIPSPGTFMRREKQFLDSKN